MFKFTFITVLLMLNICSNEIKYNQEYKTAYFASRCFWCDEIIYENIKGDK